MSDTKLYVHILLDRSGSMESCRDTTIKAFNEYVTSLKAAWKTPTRLSLTIFDSESIDLVHDRKPIADLPELTRATFVPRASTPLLDAIGRTVAHIDKAELATNERVVLVILTDGYENASREHTADSVKKLLVGRQEDKHWLVLYLGANQDAWDVARHYGGVQSASLSYDTGREGSVMRAAARSTADYFHAAEAFGSDLASGNMDVRARAKAALRDAAAFTDNERSDAKADAPKTIKPKS